ACHRSVRMATEVPGLRCFRKRGRRPAPGTAGNRRHPCSHSDARPEELSQRRNRRRNRAVRIASQVPLFENESHHIGTIPCIARPARNEQPVVRLPAYGGIMAKLLSINVGLPRNIEWKGRTVYTGIWKSPVHGTCRVSRLNLEGDGQGDLAGHGGEQRAVFVHQVESYRHWQEQLKRTDFVPGQFGENFTIEGLPDY